MNYLTGGECGPSEAERAFKAPTPETEKIKKTPDLIHEEFSGSEPEMIKKIIETQKNTKRIAASVVLKGKNLFATFVPERKNQAS